MRASTPTLIAIRRHHLSSAVLLPATLHLLLAWHCGTSCNTQSCLKCVPLPQLQAVLHRAALQKPMGVFKYAMTMDGKIATSMGHSAWVSCSLSRQQVFETRARSDAVIVGGQTVRLDNPRLTTRREGGHMPMRIVMSRTLDLQEVCQVLDP